MSMIKRGRSDDSRPSVISSTQICPKCGYKDNSLSVCPKCQSTMIKSIIDESPIEQDVGCRCNGGICKID